MGAQVCKGQMPARTANPRNKTGKAQAWNCGCELKLREPLQIERRGDIAGGDVNGDDPDENERAAEEGIKRQLHRAVFLVR